MDKIINVLVTGIGGGGHGEQIIKALKLIKEFKINLIGTDVTDVTTGKILVDYFYRVPYATSKLYEKVITEIIEKHHVNFIFHGSEPELKYFSENREKYLNKGIGLPLNSKEVISLCMNKYNCFKKLEELHITVPKFKKISTMEDIKEIDFFPLIAKPNTSSGGSFNVFICFDKEDLEIITRYMLKFNIDIIAQEYLDSLEEYTIGVSSDTKGNIIGSIALKRFLTNALSIKMKIKKDNNWFIISSGISQGKFLENRLILEQAEKIAKKINSKGPLNIQGRLIDNVFIPFEINPRLSGTTFLRALAGYNEPEALIKMHLLGEKVWLKYNEKLILRTIKEILI